MGGVVKSIISLFTGDEPAKPDMSAYNTALEEQRKLAAQQQEALTQQVKTQNEFYAAQLAKQAEQEALLKSEADKKARMDAEAAALAEEKQRKAALAAQQGGKNMTYLTRGVLGDPNLGPRKTLLGG